MSNPNIESELKSSVQESAEQPAPSDEKLAVQVHELIMAGGTVGDALNYTAQDYEALYALGHGYYQAARYDEAYKVFAYLMIHNHLELRFIMAYAASAQMLEKWDEAIHNYSLSIAMDMVNPQPMLHVCECLIGLAQYARAQEGLNLVLTRAQQLNLTDVAHRAQALLELVGDRADTPAVAV